VPDTLAAARQMIESRLAEIEAEAGELERALSHLVAGDGGRGRPRGGRRKAAQTSGSPSTGKRRGASSRKAGRRAAKGERLAQLLAAIEANPGSRPSELAAQIGIRPTQVSVLIARARSEKLIVKSGKGYAPGS
jgi:hypothetical protein